MFFCFLYFLVLLTLPLVSVADSNSVAPMINFTSGKVAVLDDQEKPDRHGVEIRFRPFGRRGFIPAIGYAFADNGASFVYTDVRRDYHLHESWFLSPSIGLGTFSKGTNFDLGKTLEFRSGIELAYHRRDQIRLGVAFFHLSNAGLSEINPGTEALVFSLSLPVE